VGIRKKARHPDAHSFLQPFYHAEQATACTTDRFATAYSNSIHKPLRRNRKCIIPMCTNVLLYDFLAKYAQLRPSLLVAKTNTIPIYYLKNNKILCCLIFTEFT